MRRRSRMSSVNKDEEPMEEEETEQGSDKGLRGVRSLWTTVNHVAIVVADVGRSLQFYTEVVGMEQINRPDFDRHGAWLTFGNLDLHLIKGRPAVHSDDDLIVSHVAIVVKDMAALRLRLGKMGVKSRKNVSVPNPSEGDKGKVDQAFVRDPDGYYIEFCACAGLEEYLHDLRAKQTEAAQNWSLSKASQLAKFSHVLRKKADASKQVVRWLNRQSSLDSAETDSTADHSSDSPTESVPEADKTKLENLIRRRRVYGDITQNVTEEELEQLLKKFGNHVPKVILFLEERVRRKGTQTFIPPAFYDRDGQFYQPPSFEMALNGTRSTFAAEGQDERNFRA